jgi:hypothetical protein
MKSIFENFLSLLYIYERKTQKKLFEIDYLTNTLYILITVLAGEGFLTPLLQAWPRHWPYSKF